ncbi:MAG: polysaccharide biosynthesis tyrosine autokinase [Bacteroidota bacterium]
MNTLQNHSEDFEGLDFNKLKTVFGKNIVLVVLIFILCITSAYLVIRWTKPLYESVSELKLDVEANATELGITSLAENQNLNVISGEIELLRSKLFFNKIIENFDLDISYFTSGAVLTDEKYKNTPFKVDYIVKDSRVYDHRIYVQLINQNEYKISFNNEKVSEGQIQRIGELVKHDWLNFTVTLTDNYVEGDENYFFVINSHQSLVNYFDENLVVEPLNLNANTIKIAITDFNKYKARDLVNTIDSIYLEYSQEEKTKENKQKIEWLNEELKQIEGQLEEYENYFENFTIENRTSDLNQDLKNVIGIINDLDSQKLILRSRISEVESLKADLNKTERIEPYTSHLPDFLKDNVQALNELVLERERLGLSYTETTFALTKKDREIDQLKSGILKNIDDLKDRYIQEIQSIEERKRVLQSNFETLPGKSTEYNKKQRFFELYEAFYLSLMQSKAEFQIAEAGTTTQFKILSAATLPGAPISPKSLIILGIGFVAGLILNFVFISLQYLIHNKITTFQELENSTSSPILGSVPKAKEKMENTSLIIDKRPKSAVSEALRSIRTNIEFMLTHEKQRVISVTSTISGEGKTFIAVNFGGIVALTKKKVVIVDLDMRKPRVHLAFNKNENHKGVSTVLINKHKVQECIMQTDVDNLHFIPAGPTPPNPSELLLNGAFDDLVNDLKTQYDLILLDTPPAGLVTDGLLAMKKADLAIYIIRANYSKKVFTKTLDRLVNINNFNNISVILNAVPRSSGNGYGYGYYDEKSIAKGSN